MFSNKLTKVDFHLRQGKEAGGLYQRHPPTLIPTPEFYKKMTGVKYGEYAGTIFSFNLTFTIYLYQPLHCSEIPFT